MGTESGADPARNVGIVSGASSGPGRNTAPATSAIGSSQCRPRGRRHEERLIGIETDRFCSGMPGETREFGGGDMDKYVEFWAGAFLAGGGRNCSADLKLFGDSPCHLCFGVSLRNRLVTTPLLTPLKLIH